MDLATPGTSKKRAAPGEGDLFETPKAKRPATSQQLSGKSLFHRVTKYNVKDKKQIYWDLRLTELMVGNNLPYEFVSSNISKRWYEEFQPQYHLKHPTTFSRYLVCFVFVLFLFCFCFDNNNFSEFLIVSFVNSGLLTILASF